MTFLVAKGRINYDFFGIGRIPARESVSVPLQTGGNIFFGEFLRNVGKNIFVGGRYQYRSLFSRIENNVRVPGGFEVPQIDLQANSVAIGVHVQRDTRDSTFYPSKGTLFNGIGDFFGHAWGSRREYQTYKMSFSGYPEVAPRQIIAYQALGCSSNGNPPFYDLCLYGVNNQLRGYRGGEFQDRRMFTTQGEYRLELPKRFGLVAFGGVGGIAPTGATSGSISCCRAPAPD
jgi:outer membrane protein assembly factor BamA